MRGRPRAAYEQVTAFDEEAAPAEDDHAESVFEIGEPDDDEEGDDVASSCRGDEESESPDDDGYGGDGGGQDINDGGGEVSGKGGPLSSSPSSEDSGRFFTTPVELDFAEGAIVAPCDLPEGYVLRIDMGRNRVLVTQIPYNDRGVSKGETFHAPYRIYDKEKARQWRPPDRRLTANPWRASLFGCCEFGPCHPSCLGAYCCQCFLLSQVMTRMHLNWTGTKSSPSVARRTMEGVFLVFAIFYFVRGITLYLWVSYGRSGSRSISSGTVSVESQDRELSNMYALSLVADVAFLCYVLVITVRARGAVRENYAIPGSRGADCCVSCLFHPCALSQMARQSADYRSHDARWFSDTGVSEEFDSEYGLSGVVVPMMDGRHFV